MKTFRIPALLITLACIFTGCDWLDVPPKTEVDSDRMFESERGFKNAIIGCYELMSDRSLYGRELTAGFLDVMAQQFSMQVFSEYYSMRDFDYTAQGGANKVSAIWNKMYETIANVNNILGNIDNKRDILHPTTYNIIKGEALGLRGFLHFELLRLFGWGDVEGDPAAQERKAIPYSFSYTKVIPLQYTGKEVLEFALKDLEQATALLESNDPWSTTNKAEGWSLPNSDGFFTNRMTRFNYWAAQATIARLHMWMGNRDKALPILEDFVRNRPAINGLEWVSDANINGPSENARDLTFSTEHIFRLDVHGLFEDNLKDIIDPAYMGVDENVRMLYHANTYRNELYESANGGTSDVRYSRLYQQSGSMYVPKKFTDFEGYEYPNNMPLIRMSEMYYMLAECYNHAGETSDAVELLNTVRSNRNISVSLGEDLTREQVADEILKEWKKEFLGEGQMFHYYKRLGFTAIKAAYEVTATAESYVLPIPESELNTGGYESNVGENE